MVFRGRRFIGYFFCIDEGPCESTEARFATFGREVPERWVCTAPFSPRKGSVSGVMMHSTGKSRVRGQHFVAAVRLRSSSLKQTEAPIGETPEDI